MLVAGQKVDFRKNRPKQEANSRKAEETSVRRKLIESINEY